MGLTIGAPVMDVTQILTTIVMVTLALVHVLTFGPMMNSRIKSWCLKNGYDLIGKKYKWFAWRTPFFLKMTGNQYLYRVTVKDAGGRVFNYWVCCGHPVLGVFSGAITAIRDDTIGKEPMPRSASGPSPPSGVWDRPMDGPAGWPGQLVVPVAKRQED